MRVPFGNPLVVNRRATRRPDADLAAMPAVVVRSGQVLVVDDLPVLLAPHEQPDAVLRIYLGELAGQDVAAVVPDSAEWQPAGAVWAGLRDVLGAATHVGALGDGPRELATTAVALAAWHDNHRLCPRCGRPTAVRKAGWVRYCEHEEREHYPRTDPAVIMAITDSEDRLLLAHASYWSERRFSHLAGYVEPGESFEQAVHREVEEEVGLEVTDIAYVGSQPWPFPASVMVGFTARAVGTELTLDNDEIAQAVWVTREEFLASVAAGEMIPPPPGSIARRMLEAWYGEQVPQTP